MKKIIIIGSGFGGLAAGIRLAARGHDVTMIEKQDKPGGKAYVLERDGFRFDTGPTVITAPFMFDELWSQAGRCREQYFELRRCDPYYRLFDHRGRHFDYTVDEQSVLDQVSKFNPADRDGYQRLLASTRPIFEKGFVQLADQPFLQFSDMLRVAPDLLRLRAHTNVYQYVSSYIQDEFLRRAFSFHPLFIGGNPFNASSIYAMVHYLEREWGIHHAVGGTGAIVNAMVRLFKELGGKLVLNCGVREIMIEQRRVTGVRLADNSIEPADVVVSNADVAHTYFALIPQQHRRIYTDARLQRMRYSMSLFVLYIATNRRYDDQNLVRHNIIFSERYKGLLKDIFGARELAEDFSLYLYMPVRDEPEAAPEGHDVFYVLSPVPHLGADIDWAERGPAYRTAILEFLEQHYLPDLRQHIVSETLVDPRHFQRVQSCFLGAAFSIEPTLLQSAWFRPHNRSEEFENLYFVGAGTHPGAGIPGVLSSAIIAERLIEADR